MSTPSSDNAFPHELEIIVETELTVAENRRPEEEPHCEQYVTGLPDPDAQRYEADLRTLLGAIEALEDSSRPPRAEKPETAIPFPPPDQ